jgi:hypothetical protein
MKREAPTATQTGDNQKWSVQERQGCYAILSPPFVLFTYGKTPQDKSFAYEVAETAAERDKLREQVRQSQEVQKTDRRIEAALREQVQELLSACKRIIRDWEQAQIPQLLPEQHQQLVTAIKDAEEAQMNWHVPGIPHRAQSAREPRKE